MAADLRQAPAERREVFQYCGAERIAGGSEMFESGHQDHSPILAAEASPVRWFGQHRFK